VVDPGSRGRMRNFWSSGETGPVTPMTRMMRTPLRSRAGRGGEAMKAIAVLTAMAAVALGPMAHADVYAADPATEGIKSCG